MYLIIAWQESPVIKCANLAGAANGPDDVKLLLRPIPEDDGSDEFSPAEGCTDETEL